MEELKVVITLKGERGTIGIQAPDCDPVFSLFEGGLEQALERVPGLVSEARERWGQSPRYPKTKHELTPPQPARPAQPAPVQTRQRAEQQRLF